MKKRLQVGARAWLGAIFGASCRDLTENELKRSAVIVAPHFDDEILGCGGTMLRKLEAGAELTVVFMTTGGKSHRHLMPEARLSNLRAAEAVAAAKRLGIPSSRIVMLGREEGQLMVEAEAVAEQLTLVFRSSQPRQIFCPYARDQNLDHEATNAIVWRAARQAGLDLQVLEYPVWAWHVWPWCPMVVPSRSDLPRIAWNSVRTNAGLVTRMRIASRVADFRDRKMEALGEYRSQMSRLVDDPRWLTLKDVGEGGLLAALSSDVEFFGASMIEKQ